MLRFIRSFFPKRITDWPQFLNSIKHQSEVEGIIKGGRDLSDLFNYQLVFLARDVEDRKISYYCELARGLRLGDDVGGYNVALKGATLADEIRSSVPGVNVVLHTKYGTPITNEMVAKLKKQLTIPKDGKMPCPYL